jgi:hypothetical protein
MAKSKSKKPAIIPEVKEEAVVQQEPSFFGDEGLFLNPDHLLHIECLQRDMENFKLRMALEEQALQNMTLTMEILKSRIEKQKIVLQSKAKEYESSKEKYHALKQDIFKIYNLPGDKFGYDPSTGKIEIEK